MPRYRSMTPRFFRAFLHKLGSVPKCWPRHDASVFSCFSCRLACFVESSIVVLPATLNPRYRSFYFGTTPRHAISCLGSCLLASAQSYRSEALEPCLSFALFFDHLLRYRGRSFGRTLRHTIQRLHSSLGSWAFVLAWFLPHFFSSQKLQFYTHVARDTYNCITTLCRFRFRNIIR